MKTNHSKFSSVSFRLTVLLISAGLIMVGYFFVITTTQRTQQEQLYASRIKSRQAIFNGFVQGSSDQLSALAVDYTYWDDMVKFVSGDGKDLDFASNNIDTALSTFGADAIWVYTSVSKPIYTTHTFGEEEINPATAPPFSEDLISSIFKKSGVYHFYLKTSYGMFEITTASIHPTTDPKRETPIKGYFFVGKLIGEDYLAAAGKSIEGSARLIDNVSSIPSETSTFNHKSGQTQFVKEISDHNNQTIGAFNVGYIATDLAKDRKAQINLTIFGIALFSILMLVLFLTLTKWVISPLKKVRHSLRKNEGGLLSGLSQKKDEFGDIARLIVEFFSQQKELSTQKAQVEELVLKRTHELRQEHARLQASIDSLQAGFMLTFGNSQVAMCNPALAKILGFTASESLDPDGTIAITLSQVEQSLKNVKLAEEINKCLSSGQSFNAPVVPYGASILSIFGAPVRLHQSEIIGCVILITDITEAKVLERSKDEFFSIASHELRTPLTSIKGNAAMIMDYYSEALKDPELKEMVSDIRVSSERLIGIVNDFLDLSRLEQGKVTFTSSAFSIEEIVESVVYEMKTVLAEKNLHLTFDKMTLDSLPRVWADKNRTKQVIYNLVGNAAKFTEKGGINISAAPTPDGQYIKILISDTGRGIPLESQKLLFHKFQQASNSLLTRDTTRGTGLGLYISKMLVESMGGHVALEHSELGKGTTFSFSLPVATQALADAALNTEGHATQTDSTTGMTSK